jgi:uncharacterized membrane protein YoaK (UPF0700 family)
VSSRTSVRELGVAAVLAVVTGYVDAVAFTRMFDVFVANQSGNVILFGIGLGDADWDAVWRPGLAMATFVAGVVCGLLLARRVAVGRRAPTLLLVECVVLVVVAAWAGDLAHRTVAFSGVQGVVLLALASFAMGIQTDVIRRAAGVSVATTYQSGTLTHLGDELAGAVARSALSPAARRALVVMGAVVTAYVVGAALGAAIVGEWGHGLWAAAAVCALVGAWLWRAPLRVVDAEPFREQ